MKSRLRSGGNDGGWLRNVVDICVTYVKYFSRSCTPASAATSHTNGTRRARFASKLFPLAKAMGSQPMDWGRVGFPNPPFPAGVRCWGLHLPVRASESGPRTPCAVNARAWVAQMCATVARQQMKRGRKQKRKRKEREAKERVRREKKGKREILILKAKCGPVRHT